MKAFLKYTLSFILILIANVSLGQNLLKDLANIQKVYTGNKALWVEVNYETHLNEVSEKPLDELPGILCFQNGMTYSKVDSIETFQNLEYSLVVDHNTKVILKNYMTIEESEAFKTRISGFDFSKFIDDYDVKEFKKVSGEKAYYVLISKTNVNEQITFIFNPSSYQIIEVQIKHLKSQSVAAGNSNYIGMPILRVVYKSQKLVKKRDNNFFTDKIFLKKQNDKEVAIAPYQKYQVITNK